MISAVRGVQEKFHLHIDFLEEDMDVDIHATPFHICCAITHVAASLTPETLGGLVTMLRSVLDEKVSSN